MCLWKKQEIMLLQRKKNTFFPRVTDVLIDFYFFLPDTAVTATSFLQSLPITDFTKLYMMACEQ